MRKAVSVAVASASSAVVRTTRRAGRTRRVRRGGEAGRPRIVGVVASVGMLGTVGAGTVGAVGAGTVGAVGAGTVGAVGAGTLGRLVALVALGTLGMLGGCSGAAPALPDARRAVGSDGGVPDSHPADAPLPVCVTPAVKPMGATGSLASGVYAITWTPIKGDPGNLNPLVGTDRLTIDVAAGTARYDRPGCLDCVGTHTGTLEDGCLLVPRGTDGTATRDEYYLCASDSGVIANLTWCGYPGPPEPRTWSVTGTP